MNDLDNPTPLAQQTLFLARKEAERLNSGAVGTEHLLLGLIRLGQGVAVNVLQKLGFDLEAIRIEIEESVGTGPDRNKTGELPYTPGAKKMMWFAAKEAKALNHAFLGTEHLLLGLLFGADGLAARVLRRKPISIERARQEILHELDPLGLGAGGISMASNFDAGTQQVLALAEKEAVRLNHSALGTEHVLLGLLKANGGPAVKVLRKLGCDLGAVRLEVEKLISVGQNRRLVGEIPYAIGVMKVLSLAAKEAQALNQPYIGTEHLLLGLLGDVEGIAARVLHRMGLTVERAREELHRTED